MEKNKNEIEDVFKEKFDDFEPEVEPKVWKNVKRALKWGSLGLLLKFVVNKIGTSTVVALVSSAVTVIGTVWVMENKKSDKASETTLAENVALVEAKQDSKTENEANTGKVLEEKNATQKKGLVKPAETLNEQSESRSFKNTEVREITDIKNVKNVISDLSKHSIAIIAASPISGTAPLIVNLNNVGTGLKNEWSFSDGQPQTSESNPARAFLAGKHTIILRSIAEDGKAEIDSIQVNVTDVSSLKPMSANSFSPNGDGNADVFSFQSRNMKSVQAEIYDKNSRLIYKWKGTDGAWDGKNLDGDDAPSGLYFYIIIAEGIDGKKYEQKAVVRLLR